MKSIGVLFIVAILTVAASLANMVVTFDKVGTVTGFSGTDTGTVNLSVTSIVDINFTTKIVNWGSGRVNTGKTVAYLDSYTPAVTDGNWTNFGSPTALVLENIGSINCTLNFTAGKTAAQFIGGTSPVYQWMFNVSESGSCIGGTTKDVFAATTTNTLPTIICDTFRFETGNDEIKVYFNLTVPEDSLKGDLGDIITATAIS